VVTWRQPRQLLSALPRKLLDLTATASVDMRGYWEKPDCRRAELARCCAEGSSQQTRVTDQ